MSSTTLPLPVRRTYGWRSWRDPLLESLLAIAVGCAFSLIESKRTTSFRRCTRSYATRSSA